MDLAEKHNFPQMEALLVRHTGQLLQKGDPLQAVEVFRMAGKATDAALLLAKLAEDAGMFRSPWLAPAIVTAWKEIDLPQLHPAHGSRPVVRNCEPHWKGETICHLCLSVSHAERCQPQDSHLREPQFSPGGEYVSNSSRRFHPLRVENRPNIPTT